MSDGSAKQVDTDTHSRSLAKAVSWRFFALAITTVVSFLVSGSFAIAVSIGVTDSLIKIFAYYLHERAWLSVRFGRTSKPNSTPES